MEELIERLTSARIGATFNFYRDGRGAGTRRERLLAYLRAFSTRPCCSSARRRAIAAPRLRGPVHLGAAAHGHVPAEAIATVVRRVLAELGVEDEALCWKSCPHTRIFRPPGH